MMELNDLLLSELTTGQLNQIVAGWIIFFFACKVAIKFLDWLFEAIGELFKPSSKGDKALLDGKAYLLTPVSKYNGDDYGDWDIDPYIADDENQKTPD